MAILDSGDRTQFDTGAVRDMRAGKGRCDLMPLDTVATSLVYMCGGEEKEITLDGYGRVYKSDVLGRIAKFQDGGYASDLHEALDIFCAFAYDGCHPTMLLEAAKHFEDGAAKYGDNNWRKGIPVRFYIDSAVRHYLKWLRGDSDEPHDRAFVWNIMCADWTCEHKPKLNGYREESSENA